MAHSPDTLHFAGKVFTIRYAIINPPLGIYANMIMESESVDAMDSSRQRDLLDHIDRVIEGALEDGTED